jgi:hypothetical protein
MASSHRKLRGDEAHLISASRLALQWRSANTILGAGRPNIGAPTVRVWANARRGRASDLTGNAHLPRLLDFVGAVGLIQRNPRHRRSAIDGLSWRIVMVDITVPPAFWQTRLLPMGTIEQWFAESGARVEAGVPVASVRVEEALHEISAPCAGKLTISLGKDAIVEPGTVLATIELP